MIARGEQNEGSETDYRRHMRALEECARKLEAMDLDPQEALAVCRQAEEHYMAVDRLLTEVEQEIDEMRAGRTSRVAD
jgi:exonuclease VII small subunit